MFFISVIVFDMVPKKNMWRTVVESLSIISAILLLGYLIFERRKRQQWQARYEAVEQRVIEIARYRNQVLFSR